MKILFEFGLVLLRFCRIQFELFKYLYIASRKVTQLSMFSRCAISVTFFIRLNFLLVQLMVTINRRFKSSVPYWFWYFISVHLVFVFGFLLFHNSWAAKRSKIGNDCLHMLSMCRWSNCYCHWCYLSISLCCCFIFYFFSHSAYNFCLTYAKLSIKILRIYYTNWHSFSSNNFFFSNNERAEKNCWD